MSDQQQRDDQIEDLVHAIETGQIGSRLALQRLRAELVAERDALAAKVELAFGDDDNE